jgi:outer membrane immunogenic protein
MNKSLLASAAIVALTASSLFASSAFAADMRLKAPAKMPVVDDWSGFYIGGNIGWSFGSQTTAWTSAGAPVGSASGTMQGVLGGLQDGYNWQSGNWVIGFESDIQFTGQSGSSSLAVATSSANLQWFGTIRGRVGVTPAPRWLVYVTGGAAYGEAQINESFAFVTANTNTIHSGWTFGGGIETALVDNWSAKLEYLYVDLGHITMTFAGIAPFTPIGTDVHVTDNIIRFGINYRFGPAAAVVARY